MSHSDQAKRLPVLVLGGTAFVGRILVDQLLEDGYAVTVVNRGRAYWGTNDPSGGRATRVTADRRKPQEFAEALRQHTPESGWLAVVDFSGYTPGDLRCALAGLEGMFGVYVFISSDSVYEACDPKWWSETARVDERCAIRPADREEQRRLRKKDTYGHEKLECEEFLRDVTGTLQPADTHPPNTQQKKTATTEQEKDTPELVRSVRESHFQGRGVTNRFVALRLADVLGPFDESNRLCSYWWWAQYSHLSPVHIDASEEGAAGKDAPDSGAQVVNYTSSEEVVAVARRVIEMRRLVFGEAWESEKVTAGEEWGWVPLREWAPFEAFNVANEEGVTLEGLVRRMGQVMQAATDSGAAIAGGSAPWDRLPQETSASHRHSDTGAALQLAVQAPGTPLPMRFAYVPRREMVEFLPSVMRRKPMDVSKFTTYTGVKPCSLEDTLRPCCGFSVRMAFHFLAETAESIRKLPKEVRAAALADLQTLHDSWAQAAGRPPAPVPEFAKLAEANERASAASSGSSSSSSESSSDSDG